MRGVTAICAHMPGDYVERFTGVGVASELVCEACATSGAPAAEASAEVFARVRDHNRVRFEGSPQVIELASELTFAHEDIALDCPELADLHAVGSDDRNRWLGVTADGVLFELDLDRGEVREVMRVAIAAPLELHVSADGRYAAVVQARGVHGVIVELAAGRVIMQLEREDYYAVQCRFPFAFVTRRDRQLAIYSPQWNRLAAFDVQTNEALTARPPIAHTDRHYLDYFHSGLHVSPGGQMIADNGWHWHPFGRIATWNLERWLTDNVWESEDGRTRRETALRDEWDVPLCWLDDEHFAVWGYGDGLVDAAAEIYDARTGKLERWFAGPERSDFVFDRVLFVLGESTTVWDVERGGRLLSDRSTSRYHPSAKCFATPPKSGRITISRLRGLDAKAPWATDAIRTLAGSIDELQVGLGVLGDALDDAGCTDEQMLAHCRQPGPHGARCWVLDRLGVG
jgi:hypothetical protein